MPHCIARIFEQLLRLLFPARGRHRVVRWAPFGAALAVPKGAACVRVPSLLRGEDSALVRPYLLAHEQRLRRQRRLVLWLASYGIDLDTRDIHGLGAA
ncbi:hypothetical protein OG735_16470 [Streptomyces sp. NBC_01210]|uniref:hypothetical protein n=1 Tax=Streptomyces sp. NBC_01210 TaxID=2903774 RepID=UPI002E0EDA0E|nr:hypothetical protein OG735_16470 [Streptomyces sp. NBC_01210]